MGHEFHQRKHRPRQVRSLTGTRGAPCTISPIYDATTMVEGISVNDPVCIGANAAVITTMDKYNTEA